MCLLRMYVIIFLGGWIAAVMGDTGDEDAMVKVSFHGYSAAGINVWLDGASLKSPRLGKSLPDMEERIFEKVKPGDYVVTLDPDYEDWSSHCIDQKSVTISNGVNNIDFLIPSGAVDIVSVFGREPNFKTKDGLMVARVEKYNGTMLNKHYKQWLRCTQDGKGCRGRLSYISVGEYLLTFVDPRNVNKQTDVVAKRLRVTEDVLKDGKTTMDFSTELPKPTQLSSDD